MAALNARGHDVRVMGRARDLSLRSHEALIRELESRNVSFHATHDDLEFELDGAAVRVFTKGRSLRGWIAARMHEFAPDVILSSTDDPAHVMFDPALRIERARLVYLIRAIIALPFGPAAPFPSVAKTAALRQVDGSVAVSEYVAEYARNWGGLNTVHLPISLPDRAEQPELGRFDNRFVTLINPCAGKGLSIFLSLAESFPAVKFAAVPTWGSTQADLAALRKLPNVSVLPPADDIDQIFGQTRIALVPSLWAEARSRIALEAMSRGIPVLASDVGGMAEAMLGMDYLLPVNPIVRYRPEANELMVPMAEIPEQDLGPWSAALARLVSSRAHYEDLAMRSRVAAVAYARSVTILPFEAYLEEIVREPGRSRIPTGHLRAPAAHSTDALSPERRRLLSLRIKRGKGRETA